MRLFRVLPLAAALAACAPAPEAPVSRVGVTAARGLHTSENALALPEGALTRADDVVIDRPGVIEPRRGESNLPALSTASPIIAWTDFQGAQVAMRADGKLARYVAGAWTDYAGTYAPAAGYKTRFAEEGKALYFTSAAGLWKLDSLTGTPVLAGGAKAIDGSAALDGASGFLPINSAVAYRFVWGVRDANGRLVLGAVSGRTVAVNPSGGTTRNVLLTVPIPSDVGASHFLQVYRSGLAATASDAPDDECRQVYEAVPTNLQLAAHSLTFTDVVPEALRTGPNLYTNPNSGGGILATKERPPLCRDVAAFRGHLVCAATTQRQRMALSLLSADAAKLLQLAFWEGGDSPILATALSVTASDTENAAGGLFKVATGGSAAQNIEDTARSIVRTINGKTGNTLYRAYYISGEDESPGKFMVEARSPTQGQFSLIMRNSGETISPPPAVGIFPTALTKSGTAVTVTLEAAHGLAVGQTFTLLDNASGVPGADANFPFGVKTVASVPTSTSLTYTESPSATATHPNPGSVFLRITAAGAGVLSANDDAPNGLAISGLQEPDAFPPLNTLSSGGPEEILRLIPLRDSVFLLKKGGGAARLVGDSVNNFRVEPFDTTLQVLAPDSAVALNNQVYALTNQGVVAFGDSGGAEILSLPIESALRTLVAQAGAQVASQAFAVPYESDRKYLLWLPASASDTAPTQAYAYSYVTQAWTRRTDAACSGYVSKVDDKLRLGLPAGGAALERKAGTAADATRADGSAIPWAYRYAPNTGGDAGVGKQWMQAQLLLAGPAPSGVAVTFLSELTGAGPAVTLTGANATNPGVLATYVTPQQMRCGQLAVEVSNAGAAGERPAFLGYALTFRAYGARSAR